MRKIKELELRIQLLEKELFMLKYPPLLKEGDEILGRDNNKFLTIKIESEEGKFANNGYFNYRNYYYFFNLTDKTNFSCSERDLKSHFII